MRRWLAIVALIGAFVPCSSLAQAPPAQAPAAAPRLFAAAGDVTVMIERARKERKPDQANFIQPIVGLRHSTPTSNTAPLASTPRPRRTTGTPSCSTSSKEPERW
jgi:hypothetical protein